MFNGFKNNLKTNNFFLIYIYLKIYETYSYLLLNYYYINII